MTFCDTLPLIWPLAFVLVGLLLIRKVGTDLQPVFVNVVGGVALNAKQNALMYAMAAIYAAAASLQALGEVATQFHWLYVAAFAKVAQPGVVAVIAYVTKPAALGISPSPPSSPSSSPSAAITTAPNPVP